MYFSLYESFLEFQEREDRMNIAWIKFIWQFEDS